jgi:hypothetical protein
MERVPLKLLFVNTYHAGGKIVKAATNGWQHVAFYDVFKNGEGVGCIAEAVRPEVGLFSISKYDEYPEKEVVELSVTSDQLQAVENKIKEILADPPGYGIDDCITAGLETLLDIELPDLDPNTVCCSQFVTEALRAAFRLLEGLPANCVTPQRLYGALRILEHETEGDI